MCRYWGGETALSPGGARLGIHTNTITAVSRYELRIMYVSVKYTVPAAQAL